MSKKLKWTKEPPSKEGWYWVELYHFGFGTSKKRIVYVQDMSSDNTLSLGFTDGEIIYDVDGAHAEWAGPIPEPE